jgi:rhodanese-related sulfurtransferase
MIEILKKLFGFGPKVNYEELVKNGAIIVDVRTRNEFLGGHINGSINIPLDQLDGNLNKIKDKNRTVITCCASGARSAFAKKKLISNGYANVYNGGGWQRLNQRIR